MLPRELTSDLQPALANLTRLDILILDMLKYICTLEYIHVVNN